MGFINEEIVSEEDKELFKSIGFTNMFGKPLNPRRWTIDRERKIILVRRGGGSFEVPKGYECTIVKRVDTFFKEKYLRTVA